VAYFFGPPCMSSKPSNVICRASAAVSASDNTLLYEFPSKGWSRSEQMKEGALRWHCLGLCDPCRSFAAYAR